ncbi:uncharacterized protein CcaverHIS019_0605660 [Cutaneotrichosporon cavernicola]|uniref:Uncharacterized protein n=1 Tax=Cutaneotrichosporon cavernicola TaxID=279322 RepID=A0AA48L8U8_9TREE|nr:uncharacterized protein CcaverHIS019_0605660 [Cutaneotrichosporon cavernicola]BEI94107.1 hypothetical protein CcaverHIS019_0605660 [Cutaneotrichosporon cavernicola]
MASTPSAISHDNVFNSAGLAIGLGIGVGATVIVFIIFGVGAMIWYRHKRAHTCNCSKVADLFPNVRRSVPILPLQQHAPTESAFRALPLYPFQQLVGGGSVPKPEPLTPFQQQTSHQSEFPHGSHHPHRQHTHQGSFLWPPLSPPSLPVHHGSENSSLRRASPPAQYQPAAMAPLMPTPYPPRSNSTPAPRYQPAIGPSTRQNNSGLVDVLERAAAATYPSGLLESSGSSYVSDYDHPCTQSFVDLTTRPDLIPPSYLLKRPRPSLPASSEGDRHHDMTVVAGWPESPLKATQSDADITSTSRNRSAKATGITGRVDGGVHVPAPLDKNKDQSSHSDDDPRLILQSLASSDTGLPLHKGLAGPLTP